MVINKKLSIFILLTCLLYISTSIGEYVIHKYLMHNYNLNKSSITNHIRHHDDVNYDMTLSKKRQNEDLYFDLISTIILFALIYVIYYIIIKSVFGYNKSYIFIIILSAFVALLYKVAWDHLHYRFHMFHKIPYNTWNKYEKITFHNHAYHHLQKGIKKGNYCIIFLGADHLFKSFNTCIDNREFCKKNYHKVSKNIKTLCDYEKQKKQLPNEIKFCN